MSTQLCIFRKDDECPRCARHVADDKDREYGTYCMYCRQDLLGVKVRGDELRAAWVERGDDVVREWLNEVTS